MADGDVVVKVRVDDVEADKLLQVGKKAESMANQVKGAGQKVKASSELFGSLANFAGGSQIGGFAGQIGQLTEKVGQFSEISKAGGAGALAFKAGLAGVAGVIGFQIGTALGDVIFQTEKWNKELEKSRALFVEIGEATREAMQGQHADRMLEFEFIRDPESKKKAITEYLDTVKKNVDGSKGSIKQLQKQIEDAEAAWFKTGNDKALIENMKVQLEEQKKSLQVYKDEKKELEGITNQRKQDLEAFKARVAAEQEAEKARVAANQKSADYVQGLREQLALLKATKDEQLQMAANKNAVRGDQDEATRLLRTIEAEQNRIDKEKELAAIEKQREKERVANANKIADIYKNQTSEIEKQYLAKLQGDQAATAFALMQQGLNKQAANEMAFLQQKLKELNSVKSNPSPELETTGRIGRFLGVVRGNDPTQQNLRNISDEAQRSNILLEEIARGINELKQKAPVKVTETTA